MFGKVHDDFKGLLEHKPNFLLSGHALDATEGVSVDQGHENAVAVGVNRRGHWELVLMQQLHEEELPDGTESGEVEPVVAGPVLDVLSVLLDTAEGVTTEPGQFEDHVLALGGSTFVDI